MRASGMEGMLFWPGWPPDASTYGDARERRLARQLRARSRSGRRSSRLRLVVALAVGLAVIAWYDADLASMTVALLSAMLIGIALDAHARRTPSSQR